MASVSVATASRALSNPDLVAEGTRKAVREAAEACGYQINLVARSLRMQRTDTILALLPGIDNQFYPAIIQGMEERAHAAGYSMILGLSKGCARRNGSYLEIIHSRRVDGLIILHPEFDSILGEKTELKLPVVLVLESPSGGAIPSIRIDESVLAGLAVEHLAALGHRRIGHISGGERSLVARQRAVGYRLAVGRAGCDPDPDLLVPGDYSFEGGMRGMEALLGLRDPPTAVFCANDSTAAGACKACRQQALSVPHDISLVGVNDVEEAAQCDPPLTTIRQPRHEIGASAVDLLIAQIDGSGLKGREVLLPVELVIRGSTAPPRQAA